REPEARPHAQRQRHAGRDLHGRLTGPGPDRRGHAGTQVRLAEEVVSHTMQAPVSPALFLCPFAGSTTYTATAMSFRALMLEKQDGGPLAHVVDLDDAALTSPEALANEVTAGDVLIRVDWSTINYKDGLAITGKGPVVRKWPMVAGIDGAGVVLDS